MVTDSVLSNMSVEMRPDEDRPITEGETVAAIDEIDGREHFVVADVTRDDAWCAIAEGRALGLAEWR